MVPYHSMPVTIFAFYEGMRLQLKFLPYEALYEEVIRRCELALGGVRLPPGVWLNCRGCGRRLSLCNNPQRRMPGECHPEDGPWEWNVNVPFMAFISLHPDGVTDAKPMRVPSKNDSIDDLVRVAARTLGLGYVAAVLSLDGKILDAESTVDECGIAEGDRLVLIRRWKLLAIRGSGDHEEEIECQIFGHMSLEDMFFSLLENNLFSSFAEVLLDDKCLWKSDEDTSKTLIELGIKNGDTIRLVQKPEHEAASRMVRLLPQHRVSSSAQTDEVPEEEEEELEEVEEVDFS